MEWSEERIRKKNNVKKLICDRSGYEGDYGLDEWLECYFNERSDNPYAGHRFEKIILNDVKSQEYTLWKFEAEFNSPKTCQFELLPECEQRYPELNCH